MSNPDLDLERSVLGALLALGEERLPSWATHLEPAHFGLPDHRLVMTAICEMIGREEPIDQILLAAKLKSWGINRISEILANLENCVVTSVGLSVHAKRLIERRQASEAISRLQKLVSGGKVPSISEMSEELGRIQESLIPHMGTSGFVPISTVVTATIRDLTREAEGKHSTIGTGLVELDDLVKMRPGELTILGGRPSMGKTALAISIASAAAKEGAVAISSLEMSAIALAKRMLGSKASLGSRQLVRAVVNGDAGAVRAAQALYESRIWIDERSGQTIENIRHSLRGVGKKISLLIIDYLQLARQMSGDRDDIRIGDIAKGGKEIAKECGCHVLLLSQLNRAVEDRVPPEPRLRDLRGSGNIEEHADNVIFIYRPFYYDTSADPQEIQLDVAKQRNGPTGSVVVRYDLQTQRFSNWG